MSYEYFPLTGRIVLDDDGGTVIFDSDADELLSVHPDDVVVSSQVVPQRVAYSEGVDGDQIVVDLTQDYPITAVDIQGAKVVRGLIRVVRASNPEPGDNLWRQAGGTHVDLIDGVSQTTVPQSDLGGYNRVASISAYTLYVNAAGVLMLQERCVMRCRDRGSPPAAYRYREAATIEFRLLIGFFLGADFTPRPAVSSVRDARIFTTTTYSGSINFGATFSNRTLLVGLATQGASYPTAVTIGGVVATLHPKFYGSAGTVCLASANVAADGDVAVSVTMNTSGVARLYPFVGRNIGALVSVNAENVPSGTTITVPINVQTDQIGITLGAVSPYYGVSGIIGASNPGLVTQHDEGIGYVSVSVSAIPGYTPPPASLTFCGYLFGKST